MSDLNLSKIKPLALAGIISAIVIVLILLGVGILTRSKKQSTSPQVTPSVVPFHPAQLPQPTGFEKEVDKIKPILPYKTTNYTIEYLSPINIINVKITAKNRDEFLKAKQDAESFLKAKGVEDLCKLSIFWIAQTDTNTRKSLSPKDLTTTNCPLD